MSIKNTRLVALLLVLVISVAACFESGPESNPEGTAFAGEFRKLKNIKFLFDITYRDENNNRIIKQSLFDEIFQLIDQSNRFILVDMFLFNSFKGKQENIYRHLAEELTQALINQKKQYPECEIILITDPINTVYGGMPSDYLERIKQSGISLTFTDLNKLRDSNPVYSILWRNFLNSDKKISIMLPSPFGEGQVTLSEYLHMLNFKANHRKLIIGVNDEQMTAIVSSANAHDGSSAHGNIGVKFSGKVVEDLLITELAVLNFSEAGTIRFEPESFFHSYQHDKESDLKVRILTESAIKNSVVFNINSAQKGDAIDMAMFYLSERNIIEALKAAKNREVKIKILLDPNKDAFGRKKNGIPNRQVAHELVQEGIDVRWCNTHGEQCHSKLIMFHRKDNTSTIILGSANFTRRNLDDFNLETNVEIQGVSSHPEVVEVMKYFSESWRATENRKISVDYSVYHDGSQIKYWLYRFMEYVGISTF